MTARTACGSSAAAIRTVKPAMTPSAVNRSMRFCTVPRDIFNSSASFEIEARPSVLRIASKRRSVLSMTSIH
ncbi:hypothetical protein D3C87_2104310 [compost metagenome]